MVNLKDVYELLLEKKAEVESESNEVYEKAMAEWRRLDNLPCENLTTNQKRLIDEVWKNQEEFQSEMCELDGYYEAICDALDAIAELAN